MGILRTLKKAGGAVVKTVSMLSVAFCLTGSIGFCFCDPDPDDCGEHCHDCTEHPEDECHHLSIDLDEFLVPQSDDTIPQMADDAPSRFLIGDHCTVAGGEFRSRPASTAPPDTGGGRYLSYSSRIHPLS